MDSLRNILDEISRFFDGDGDEILLYVLIFLFFFFTGSRAGENPENELIPGSIIPVILIIFFLFFFSDRNSENNLLT